MPIIKPTSVEDFLKFIKDHRSDIENGTYGIDIEDNWIPHISNDDLLFLAETNPSCRRSIADHSGTPENVIVMLANDSDSRVRAGVARNPNTPPHILSKLASDFGDPRDYCGPGSRIRESVASNPNTPPKTLSFLSKSESSTVRRSAAENINLPPESLSVLARDVEIEICRAVASNPNTPVETLEMLCRDTGEGYRNALPPEWNGEHIRSAVASNRNAPPHILDVLAKDKSSKVRESVAANRSGVQPAEFYQKQKFWRNFWKVAPYSVGFLGVPTMFSGSATAFFIGTSIGILWALFVAKLGGPDDTD